MTERIDARQLALFGAALIGADAVLKAESRYVQDVRRDVLRKVDRGLHRTRRRVRSVATGLELALIALVVLTAVASQRHQRQRAAHDG